MSGSSNLMVRLDEESKATITKAAKLRKISTSDYVRSVMVRQARREVMAHETNQFVLTPDEQLAFWEALNQPVALTPAQKDLGALMQELT